MLDTRGRGVSGGRTVGKVRVLTVGLVLGCVLLSMPWWLREGSDTSRVTDLDEGGLRPSESLGGRSPSTSTPPAQSYPASQVRTHFADTEEIVEATSASDSRTSSLFQERTSRMSLPRGFAPAIDYARNWSEGVETFPEPWLTRLQLMVDSYNRDLEAARSQVLSAQHAFLDEDVRLRGAGVPAGSAEAKQLVQAAKQLGEGFVAQYADRDPETPNRVVHLLPGADPAVDSAYDDLWAVVDQGQAAILHQLEALP